MTLRNLKKPGPIFCLSPFSNIEKGILKNLEKSWPSVLLIRFSNIQKCIIRHLKKLAQFSAHPLLKYF